MSTIDQLAQDTAGGATDWVAVARSLASELAPKVAERERDDVLPFEEVRTLKELGLVNLLIPREWGGEGADFVTTTQVLRELARGEGSIAVLLKFHFQTSLVPRYLDVSGGAEALMRASAEGRWLWGNLHVPRLDAEPDGDGGYVVNGVKPWNTAAGLADVVTIVARRSDSDELLYAAIPTDRTGLTVHHDWDHLGLRRMETPTVEVRDLVVSADEIYEREPAARIGLPPHVAPGFPSLFLPTSSTLTSACSVGLARGAFDAARDFIGPGGASPAGDAGLRRLGRHRTRIDAADALLRRAAAALDEVVARPAELTEESYREVVAQTGRARAYGQTVALAVARDAYEVAGRDAAVDEFALDRFWRDVRTLAQHDPLSYVHKALGEGFLRAGTARA